VKVEHYYSKNCLPVVPSGEWGRKCRFVAQFCCGGCSAWLPGNALPHGRAVMRLKTGEKSNFFDYDRPLRELVAPHAPQTDPQWINDPTTASTASGQICDYIPTTKQYVSTHRLSLQNTTLSNLHENSFTFDDFLIVFYSELYLCTFCAKLISADALHRMIV